MEVLALRQRKQAYHIRPEWKSCRVHSPIGNSLNEDAMEITDELFNRIISQMNRLHWIQNLKPRQSLILRYWDETFMKESVRDYAISTHAAFPMGSVYLRTAQT